MRVKGISDQAVRRIACCILKKAQIDESELEGITERQREKLDTLIEKSQNLADAWTENFGKEYTIEVSNEWEMRSSSDDDKNAYYNIFTLEDGYPRKKEVVTIGPNGGLKEYRSDDLGRW